MIVFLLWLCGSLHQFFIPLIRIYSSSHEREEYCFSIPWLWIQSCDLFWLIEWGRKDSVTVLNLCLRRLWMFPFSQENMPFLVHRSKEERYVGWSLPSWSQPPSRSLQPIRMLCVAEILQHCCSDDWLMQTYYWLIILIAFLFYVPEINLKFLK